MTEDCKYDVSDERERLPVPRLEIRWRRVEQDARYNWEAWYCLVYRHLLGEILFVPLGREKVWRGAKQPLVEGGVVDTPFRNGAHILYDMLNLNLPGYVVCEGVVTTLSAGEDLV